MPYLTDNAIILRVTDFSETSQIASLFTQQFGVVPLMAKGAKRITKSGNGKMSGPLDLLAAGEVLFIPPKGGELGTLAGWQLDDQRNALRSQLASLNASFVAAEIALALLHPHDPHARLFAELEATLTLLVTPQRQRALVAFAKAALVESGYRPEFSACVICSQPVRADKEYLYSPGSGGVMDLECMPPAEKAQSIKLPGRIAIALDRLPWPQELLKIPPAHPGDSGALLQAMLVLLHHVESVSSRGLRTRALLSTIFASAKS